VNILMIYPNQREIGHKPLGLSMLSASLKEDGHNFEPFDVTGNGVKTKNRTRRL